MQFIELLGFHEVKETVLGTFFVFCIPYELPYTL